MWLEGSKRFEQLFLAQQRQGRTLNFYSCSGPAKLLDPYSYYRLQAWHCWQIGATGTFFWAFGDNSGSSSWNEYAAVHSPPYTPLFLDDETVVAGKQMEAIRESVEDFEYFVLLRRAAERAKAAGRSAAAVARAESLLQTAPNASLEAPVRRCSAARQEGPHAGRRRARDMPRSIEPVAVAGRVPSVGAAVVLPPQLRTLPQASFRHTLPWSTC